MKDVKRLLRNIKVDGMKNSLNYLFNGLKINLCLIVNVI